MVHRIVSAIAFSAAFLGAMGNGKFGIPVVELPLGELALESLNASGHGRILDGVFFFSYRILLVMWAKKNNLESGLLALMKCFLSM